MLKQLLLAASIMLLPATVLTGCDKDEPEVTVPDEPNNGSNDKDDDEKEKPGDEKPDVPDESGEKKVTVNADGTTSDGSHFRRINETTFMLNYVKYSICDGHIEVTGHDNTEIGLSLNGKVDLYSTIVINNVSYKVRIIGARAFFECNSLKEINIPSSVISIKEYAFQDCVWLISIDIPNSVTEIGEGAFYDCISLKSAHLPNKIRKINPQTFIRNVSLEQIIIPNSVRTIGLFAFEECWNLNYVDIPEGVIDITGAFLGLFSARSLSLPSTLEHFESQIDTSYDSGYYDFGYMVEYIYFKSLTPPTYDGKYSFNSCTIFVPNSALDAYKSSQWAKSCSIIGVNPETFDFVQYLKDKGVYDF